jgi:hypothetical protein
VSSCGGAVVDGFGDFGFDGGHLYCKTHK